MKIQSKAEAKTGSRRLIENINRDKEIKLKRAETGQQSPSRKVGNLAADEGKPTAGRQGIVEKWQRTRHARERADIQQVFGSFLM